MIHTQKSCRHECRQCCLTFRYPKDLERHVTRHSNSKGHRFACTDVHYAKKFSREDYPLRYLCSGYAESIWVDGAEKRHHSRSDSALTDGSGLPVLHQPEASRFNALNVGVKTGVLLASSACLHVVSNYGRSARLPISRSGMTPYIWGFGSVQVRGYTIPKQTRLYTDQVKGLMDQPQWLAHPHPLLLLATSVGAGSLLVCYHQRNVGDEYQNSFLLMALATSMAAGLLPGHSLLTTALTTAPWALYFSLILSDLCHLVLKRRSHARVQCTNDNEKQQMFEPVDDCVEQ